MELEKATLVNSVSGERIPVLFNPTQYSLKSGVSYAVQPVVGLSAPVLQFVHGQQRVLDMDLFVDTREQHDHAGQRLNRAGDDVREVVERIVGLMDVEPSTHAPPVLLFVWGTLSFTCVLTSASQQYTVFLADGTPVRARLKLTFGEYKNAEVEAKETKRETSDYSKSYLVKDGDTLSGISGRTYGNAKVWRAIALRNRIDDPMGLTPGRRLVIPRLPYRHPATGEVFR